MSINKANPFKHKVLKQYIAELETKNKADKAIIKDIFIFKIKENRTNIIIKNTEFRARVVKLEQDIDEFKEELKLKKIVNFRRNIF
ncbi:hypothetical protein RhiirA5_429913 [Rhizophagus irregularis]|uniref:Uncharacterized protein n=1 Tax=Rhizophagus irregularis TaxID=588596 RepID=A0A2N0NXM3_9GLOM|nr:hypothetical protein RhiirA5_429913 [Rhizophagus irregularis]